MVVIIMYGGGMTYRPSPRPDCVDTTLQSRYMLTNFSPCDVVDDRAARLVIGAPTRTDCSRAPSKK